MGRPVPDTVFLTVWVMIQLACASVVWSEERAEFPKPEEVRATYEAQMADVEVIPKTVQDAFVAAEDRNFFGPDSGTSNITRQLTQRFISPGRGVLAYKVSELSITLTLETALEREEILAWYLHGIYLGRGCYGVAAASQAYFGRKPEALTLAQVAMLAALPVSPTMFDPARRPENAFERRNLVLAEMVKAGFVTEAAATTAAATPVEAIVPPGKCAD